MISPAEIEARLERVLLSVQKPGRYVGGEFNSIFKRHHEPGHRGISDGHIKIVNENIFRIVTKCKPFNIHQAFSLERFIAKYKIKIFC